VVIPEDSFLDELADSVADGRAVDWSKAESTAKTPRERALVAQLRLLAQVGALREMDSSDSPATASFSVSSPTSPLDETVQSSGGSTPQDDAAETATRVFWRHLEIAAEIGKGAFGTVYRAWDPNLHREVALKLVDVDPDDLAVRSAVINEARLLARVRHTNVVAIHGAEQASGKIGLWMEFIRGRTLREIVNERGPLSPREAIGICLELSRALAAVHAAGLVHRDVKAQNVMREHGGRIVLMDFGAGEEVANSAPRRLRGTPVYMAPELVNGGAATPRSDVYSLGVLLFYLVTGTHPISGNAVEEVQAAHRQGQRKLLRDLRPDAPPAFIRCVEQLLEADPARRIQTAGAAEVALLRALEETKRPARFGVAGVAAAIAAVILMGVGINALWTRFAAGGASVRSLAVLPMVNLSGDPGQEYFVDGMTDLLIAELSRISSLRVTSRTSVMGYKQTKKRIDEIARELDVDTVLEASVMLSGPQVRLNASLIRRSDQARLWGKLYEQPIRDAFGLQATLARDLADGVRLAITPAERRHLQNVTVVSQEAQDLYLKGRFVFHLQDHNRAREACELLEQAVKLDPKFAIAWATLARCYAYLGNYGLLLPEAARPLIAAAASRAIAEDDSVVEAHIELALQRFLYEWDWQLARDGFEQAVRQSPNNSLARDRYARFLSAAGRTTEAVEQARRGVQSDPQSASMRGTLALMLFYHRQYAEALQRSNEAIALEPSNFIHQTVRARTLAALARYDEAIQSMQQAAAATSQRNLWGEVAQYHARAGRTDEALAILAKLPGIVGPDGFTQSEDAAFILAALGRNEEALQRLEQAVDARSPRILWLRVDPRVDALRQDPRFTTLLTRIGGLD
jgi:TolB-like protein/tetratricopeptide (TPR) repeat protein/predicted Ser/Thr protein kinase